uniref:DH domain-containing protein n=1 Tax=Heterorhabditis bacteriophora TaxID=37862 RepID=A0A1I7XHJ1_HETBA
MLDVKVRKMMSRLCNDFSYIDLKPDIIQPGQQQQASQDGCCSTDNVIIVPHVQITPNESHLFNRAISSGGDLQRATIAAQAFYAENSEPTRARSPWILKRLYEWSNRAKRREIIKHVQAALETSKDHELEDDELEKLLPVSWDEMFEGALDEQTPQFSKGPSTISAYQAYCINYKATMEYLGSIRQKEERFSEFERICLADERCFRLQLEDLLIAPLQRITRLPILLREIHKYTANEDDKAKVEKVIESMNESLRSIDDSVQWLHNFERLQQLQTQVIWPSIVELEPRSFIPDVSGCFGQSSSRDLLILIILRYQVLYNLMELDQKDQHLTAQISCLMSLQARQQSTVF